MKTKRIQRFNYPVTLSTWYVSAKRPLSFQKIIKLFVGVSQFLVWPVLFILFHFFFRIRMTGKEYFKKVRQPFIIAANHIAWYDSFLFRLALGFLTPHLPLRFMAVKEFEWRILNFLRIVGVIDLIYTLFGVFTIATGKGIGQNLKTAREILETGGNIVMYPEGRITNNGTLGEFKKGTAVLALETRVPVIPVVFHLQSSGLFRRQLSIIIGEPIVSNSSQDPHMETSLYREKISVLLASCTIPILATIDRDQGLNLEINSIRRKILNFFLIPILNSLPVRFRIFVRKSHQSVDEIIEHATTHRALELLYQQGKKEHTKTLFARLAHWIWFNTNNAKSIRNRIRIVKRELKKTIIEQLSEKRALAILSVASGSARAVIETLEELKVILSGTKLEVVFLDKDDLALMYSKKLAQSHRVFSPENKDFNLRFVNSTASAYLRGLPPESFDIIEMVGFVDYLNDEKARTIFSIIFKALRLGGLFITANINPNFEQTFITRIIGWRMIYRTAEEFGLLLAGSGFGWERVTLKIEPLRVHTVAVVKK